MSKLVKHYDSVHIAPYDFIYMMFRYVFYLFLKVILQWVWIMPLLPIVKATLVPSLQPIHIPEILGRSLWSVVLLTLTTGILWSKFFELEGQRVETIRMLSPGWFRFRAQVSFYSYQIAHPNDKKPIKNYYMDVAKNLGTDREYIQEYVLHFKQDTKQGPRMYWATTYTGVKICPIFTMSDELLGKWFPEDRRIDYIPYINGICLHFKGDHLERGFREMYKRIKHH